VAVFAVSNAQMDLAAAYPLKTCPTKCVLICLANFADDSGGSCYPSIAKIAEWCSLSPRGVQMQLRKLESKPLCLITRDGTRGRTSCGYQLHIPDLQPDRQPRTPCRVDFGSSDVPTLHAVRANPARRSFNPARRAPDPLDPQGIPKIKVQACTPTPAIFSDPGAPMELGLGDQVLEGKPDPKRIARLELLCGFEKALGSGWPNDKRKWTKRVEVDQGKCQRVLDQVNDAARLGEIDTDAARYAESQWQLFRSHLPSFNPRTDEEQDFMALVCQCAGVHHFHLEFAWYLRVYRTQIHKRKPMAAKIRKLKTHPDRHRKNWHTIATADVQKEFPELVAA
jgi:hypothetical protein